MRFRKRHRKIRASSVRKISAFECNASFFNRIFLFYRRRMFLFKDKNRFIFKMAGQNGFASLMVLLLMMLCVHLNVPEGYGFDAVSLSLTLGAIAGVLTIIFTLLPIKKVRGLSVVHQ